MANPSELSSAKAVDGDRRQPPSDEELAGESSVFGVPSSSASDVLMNSISSASILVAAYTCIGSTCDM